jgi:hypothetical protein
VRGESTELNVSVSLSWRRTSLEMITSSSPQELLGLFQDWGRQSELWDALLVHAVDSDCTVMDQVLFECGPDEVTAVLPVFGGEPRTESATNPDGEVRELTVVTVLAPDAVAAAARMLADAAYGAWIAAMVLEFGFSTPWSGRWAQQLIEHLEDLEDFYRVAAEAGDAVVKYLNC